MAYWRVPTCTDAGPTAYSIAGGVTASAQQYAIDAHQYPTVRHRRSTPARRCALSLSVETPTPGDEN